MRAEQQYNFDCACDMNRSIEGLPEATKGYTIYENIVQRLPWKHVGCYANFGMFSRYFRSYSRNKHYLPIFKTPWKLNLFQHLVTRTQQTARRKVGNSRPFLVFSVVS